MQLFLGTMSIQYIVLSYVKLQICAIAILIANMPKPSSWQFTVEVSTTTEMCS